MQEKKKIRNFNSTMVRLKEDLKELRKCKKVFQFHNGTIKSLHFIRANIRSIFDFNSTMVRLKEKGKKAPAVINIISIPQWYD